MKTLLKTIVRVCVPRACELKVRHMLHKLKKRVTKRKPSLLQAGAAAGIIAPSGFLDLAVRMQGYLEKAGCGSEILTTPPQQWGEGLYFLIAPQSWELAALPTRYAVVQPCSMEGAPWYTDRYTELLRGAVAVLDASLENLAVLLKGGFRMAQLFYMEPAEGMEEFYFLRFLLAQSAIGFDTFFRLAGHHIRLAGDRVCLGLPEAVLRYKRFHQVEGYRSFQYVPGLRHAAGWIGCAYSYKFLLAKAAEAGLERIIIIEDDVDFPAGWDKRLELALEYLQSPACGRWDVFSAIIAEMHPKARCSKVVRYKGERYVHLDRMVSMVLNIYNKSFFHLLDGWDEKDDFMLTNTIDRYIESRSDLSIVVAEPYMVDHLSNLDSTLWERNNGDLYDGMLENSRRKIKEIADAWEAEHPIN